MTDEDLERRLRRYQPVAPSASLRARIVGTPGSQRAWPWAAAAAALLALTIWLHGVTARVMDVSAIDRSSAPRAEEALLTDLLGGGEDARAMARTIIALDDARTIDEPVGTTGIREAR